MIPPCGQIIAILGPKLFTLGELKSATRNFRPNQSCDLCYIAGQKKIYVLKKNQEIVNMLLKEQEKIWI